MPGSLQESLLSDALSLSLMVVTHCYHDDYNIILFELSIEKLHKVYSVDLFLSFSFKKLGLVEKLSNRLL